MALGWLRSLKSVSGRGQRASFPTDVFRTAFEALAFAENTLWGHPPTFERRAPHDDAEGVVKVIAGNVMLCEAKGKVNDIMLDGFIASLEVAAQHISSLGYPFHQRITDVSGLSSMSRAQRKRYVNALAGLNDINPCRLGLLVGVSYLVQVAIQLAKRFLSQQVDVERDIESAFARINGSYGSLVGCLSDCAERTHSPRPAANARTPWQVIPMG